MSLLHRRQQRDGAASWDAPSSRTCTRVVVRPPARSFCTPEEEARRKAEPPPDWIPDAVAMLVESLGAVQPMQQELAPWQHPSGRPGTKRPLRFSQAFVIGISGDFVSELTVDALMTAWIGESTLEVTPILAGPAGAQALYTFRTEPGEPAVIDSFDLGAASMDAWEMLEFTIKTDSGILLPPTNARALQGKGLGIHVPERSLVSVLVQTLDTVTAFPVRVSLDGWFYAQRTRAPASFICGSCKRRHG